MTVTDPREIVAAKRDGHALAAEEVETFVDGYTRGEIGDGPAAAFLMACLLRGMDGAETLALTRALVASGDTVRLVGLDRPTVDKHSTGGVADGVTLVFAPLAASLGMAVAKLSGRGLGHTGGTLDKLESIPGLRTDLSPDEMQRQVRSIGCAVAAQSSRLVPADGKLYALRDATATVPSIPLIAASVMSKKLAVETDLILLDVKAGAGAFMKTVGDAEALAEACLELARGWGRQARVAVSDMGQPLGDAVGNALDVAEAIDVLGGSRRGRLRDLAVAFAARGLSVTSGRDVEPALAEAERALDDGSALDRFRAMIEAQGGDPHVVDDPRGVLPSAPVVLPIESDRTGTIHGMATHEIGLASGALGAGRMRKGDPVDPAVGIVVRCKIGDVLERGRSVGEVHARDHDAARVAARAVLDALVIGDDPATPPPLVHAWLE
ncbi:MAG TPA: thymidine phosphorylase [Actinomycetota bacterium]|nr:thymidine phosphorylase [Actinomycetota bacterium]